MSKQKRKLTYSYATQSFRGYLEGTGKASHTLASYMSDLKTFETYLNEGLGKKSVSLTSLSLKDLEHYHDYLKTKGFKTNSRRRKVLTVRRFLKYLTSRNRLKVDFAKKVPAPYKVERVPFTLPYQEFLEQIKALPTHTDLHRRNRLLLWSLLETGCLVSEVCRIRFEDFAPQLGDQPNLTISGKNQRTLTVSPEFMDAVAEYRQQQVKKTETLFSGFNKFGPLKTIISPRGVELLVKAYSKKFNIPELVPRIFRHSAVLGWYQQGMTKKEIQKRLGLKTDYAFRVFEPLFESLPKSTNAATSSLETDASGS